MMFLGDGSGEGGCGGVGVEGQFIFGVAEKIAKRGGAGMWRWVGLLVGGNFILKRLNFHS